MLLCDCSHHSLIAQYINHSYKCQIYHKWSIHIRVWFTVIDSWWCKCFILLIWIWCSFIFIFFLFPGRNRWLGESWKTRAPCKYKYLSIHLCIHPSIHVFGNKIVTLLELLVMMFCVELLAVFRFTVVKFHWANMFVFLLCVCLWSLKPETYYCADLMLCEKTEL